MASGSKNTLAVGAAAAVVGVVVGVVTPTGVGFRLGFVVVQTATDIDNKVSGIWPFSLFALQDWVPFFSLVLIAPGIKTSLIGLVLVAPVLYLRINTRRQASA